MNPLCLTLIRRPDLVVDHLSAYAALFKEESKDASKTIASRFWIWLIAILSVAICVVFSGVALMLGVLNNQFHWILIVVPATMAILALGAFSYTKKSVAAEHFSTIKSQLSSDALALRLASGRNAT